VLPHQIAPLGSETQFQSKIHDSTPKNIANRRSHINNPRDSEGPAQREDFFTAVWIMIWVLILVFSIWIDYEFVNVLVLPVWDQLTVLSPGIPVGITFVTWIFFLIHFFRPLDRAVGVIVSLTLLVAWSVAHRWNLRTPKFRRLSPESLITLFFFSVLFSLLCNISYPLVDKSLRQLNITVKSRRPRK
jgi:hypothetical protein